MQLLTALLSALIIAASTNASPIDKRQLFLLLPKITSPHRGEEWSRGSTQTVRWDTSRISGSAKDVKGVIYIAVRDDETGTVYNRGLLAQGFRFGAGSQQVTVPYLMTMLDSYVVSLSIEGSTELHHLSPAFTIS